jgi:hypothetical protein
MLGIGSGINCLMLAAEWQTARAVRGMPAAAGVGTVGGS